MIRSLSHNMWDKLGGSFKNKMSLLKPNKEHQTKHQHILNILCKPHILLKLTPWTHTNTSCILLARSPPEMEAVIQTT